MKQRSGEMRSFRAEPAGAGPHDDDDTSQEGRRAQAPPTSCNMNMSSGGGAVVVHLAGGRIQFCSLARSTDSGAGERTGASVHGPAGARPDLVAAAGPPRSAALVPAGADSPPPPSGVQPLSLLCCAQATRQTSGERRRQFASGQPVREVTLKFKLVDVAEPLPSYSWSAWPGRAGRRAVALLL
jgi:hypothetical protein